MNISHFFSGIKDAIAKLLIAGLVVSLITVSYFPVFITTFYYDLRTRKEGSLEYSEQSETGNGEPVNTDIL